MPAYLRRLLLRAHRNASPSELRELNYAERRMALFLIFSAISTNPPRQSFVSWLRVLAGKEWGLVKSIVSFL
jgi:hypothetical protein